MISASRSKTLILIAALVAAETAIAADNSSAPAGATRQAPLESAVVVAPAATKDATAATAPKNSSQVIFNANKTAFIATTVLAIGTAAAAMGAVAAANRGSNMALFSYSALALTGSALSIAAISAWWSFGDDRANTDSSTYLQRTSEHAAMAMAGIFQFVAQTLVVSVVQGIAQGVTRSVSRSVGGEDQRIKIVR